MAERDDTRKMETMPTTGRVWVEERRVPPYEYRTEDEISLLELAGVLLRHRRWIAALTLLIPVLVVGVTILLPRSYTGTASFMPQTRQEAVSSQLSNLAGQFGFDIPAGSETGQSPQFYADLLTSRGILGSIATDTFSVADTIGLWARAGVQEGTLAALLEVEGESAAQRRANVIDWLREEAVSTTTGTETGVVELSVETPWPELSSQIAARLIDLVNEFNLETRQSQAAAERRFIEGRLKEARADLRAAENELEAFLRNNRQFQDSPELVFQHDRLQRRVNMQQQLVNSLSQAYEQARIDEVRNTPVITVVEEAEPPVEPNSRHLPLKAALGLVFGGALGVFVAFGREYLDRNREENAEDFSELSALWKETKSDVTGVVRRIRPTTSASSASADDPGETHDS